MSRAEAIKLTEICLVVVTDKVYAAVDSGLLRGSPERRSAVKRRILAAIAAAVLSLGVAAPMAYADPDFGPGNSSKGPNDGGRSVILRARRWTRLAASRSRALKHCVASGCIPEATLLLGGAPLFDFSDPAVHRPGNGCARR
jgi:hypothetical protein